MSDKDSNDPYNTESLFQIFTDSNIVIILWFLAVYFIVYLVLNIVRGKDGARSSISRWIDIVALLCLLIYLGFSFFNRSDSEKTEMLRDLYSKFKSYLNSPLSLLSVGFFIFTLYIVIYILAIPMDSFGKPITVSIIENGAWIFFVIILFSVFLKYVAGVSLTEFFDNVGKYLKEKAEEATASTKQSGNLNASSSSVSVSSQPSATTSMRSKDKNEVFNVGNNMFTYDDAQSVCASYGARLATYDEVESTYNNGGEWCNYGWSDGQAAYFPTQKATWQTLQKSESTKHSCGRPGVNGGHIANPNARFGANCFGQKPKASTSDLAALSAGKTIPKSSEDVILDKKVEFWKNNRDKLLQINGYNNNKWSAY
jgi:hypothetical protein